MDLSPSREPVFYGSLVAAALAAAASYGLPVTPELKVFAIAAAPIVIGFVIRQFVTPTAAPVLQAGTAVTILPAPASQQAVTTVLTQPLLPASTPKPLDTIPPPPAAPPRPPA